MDTATNTMPLGEIVRICLYIAGFAVGLVALSLGIWKLYGGEPENGWTLVTLGGALTGLQTVATAYVPSVEEARKGGKYGA